MGQTQGPRPKQLFLEIPSPLLHLPCMDLERLLVKFCFNLSNAPQELRTWGTWVSPQTGTPSCASQLLQPDPAQEHRQCHSSFPPNSEAVPGSQSFVPPRLAEDEQCWLQKTWIFPDALTNNAFPGNHHVHLSGGVCMGWDTAQGATESFSPWIRARSSWFATGMGRSSGTELVPLVCPPAPLACTEQASPSPPSWLPNNSRINPSAPGSHLAPLC